MTSKDLSIFNSLRPFSIGFDDMFDQFESMLGNGNLTMQSNYPPYNIRKTGKDNYAIEVALAGFSKNDIEVEFDALNFGLLTDDSKRKIIQIVHADYKQQGEQKLDTLEKIREDKLSYWNTDGITEDDMTLTVENKEENE